MIETYNDDVLRWQHAGLNPADIHSFVTSDEHRIGWSGDLKAAVIAGEMATYFPNHVRTAVYRPFVVSQLYFDRLLNNSVYRIPTIFPTEKGEAENVVLWLKVGTEWPMFALAVHNIPDLLPQGGSQCFPFYVYDEDGTHRRENITDWALEQFRSHYSDTSITKWDIFHYVYAVLHHPDYRRRYAANLRRELPRIPFVRATSLNNCHSESASADEESAVTRPPQELQIPRSARDDKQQKVSASSVPSVVRDLEIFREFAKSGQRLAEIHVHYE